MTTKDLYIVLNYDWIKKGGFESWKVFKITDKGLESYSFERLGDHHLTQEWKNLAKYNTLTNYLHKYTVQGIFTEDEMSHSRYISFWYGINKGKYYK